MIRIKSLLFFIILSVICMNISNAQEINYGLSIGYCRTIDIYENRVTLVHSNPNNYFNFMGILEFSAHRVFRIQSGLKYFRMGYSIENQLDANFRTDITPSSKSFGLTRSYLAIPVDINYFIPFLSDVYLSGGMQGVYLLSSSAYSKNFDGTYNEWDTKDEYKSHFFMYIVGIGIEYQINKVTLFIEPEYARSTRDVGNVSDSYKSYRIEQYSINIGLKL